MFQSEWESSAGSRTAAPRGKASLVALPLPPLAERAGPARRSQEVAPPRGDTG